MLLDHVWGVPIQAIIASRVLTTSQLADETEKRLALVL